MKALGIETIIENVHSDSDDRLIQIRWAPFVSLILKEVAKGTFTMLDPEGQPLTGDSPRPVKLIEGKEHPEGA